MDLIHESMTFMDYGVEHDLGSPGQCPPKVAQGFQRGQPARGSRRAPVCQSEPRPCCSLPLLMAHPLSAAHSRIRFALHVPACMRIFAPCVPSCNPPPISCLSSYYFVAGRDLFLPMCHIMITTSSTTHHLTRLIPVLP